MSTPAVNAAFSSSVSAATSSDTETAVSLLSESSESFNDVVLKSPPRSGGNAQRPAGALKLATDDDGPRYLMVVYDSRIIPVTDRLLVDMEPTVRLRSI
jgi:hypothetical protein